jgi:hypothetical protein
MTNSTTVRLELSVELAVELIALLESGSIDKASQEKLLGLAQTAVREIRSEPKGRNNAVTGEHGEDLSDGT